jgi:hypothetical protein
MGTASNRRQAERIYTIKPTDIVLKGTSYRINDISNEGIGLVLEDENPTFFMGERIDAIPLRMTTRTITLKGIVTHMSKSAAGTICGIRFLFQDSEEFKAALQFKEERRSEGPLH